MPNEILEKIKDALDTYDIILLMWPGRGDDGLAGRFLRSQILKESGKKVLVLSASPLPYEGEGFFAYRRIPEKEADALYRLYHMYEFSDRFRTIGATRQYGSLMNYAALGLLTEQEMFQSFLGRGTAARI